MPSDEQQPGPAYFTVDPDKIHRVKRGFEQELDDIRTFLREERRALMRVRPLGADPRSEIAAGELSENGASAVEAIEGYINVLSNIVSQLEESIKAYGLTEEGNVNRLRDGQE